MTPEEHQSFVDLKRRNRMEEIDSLPKEVRDLVHEFGFSVVKTFIDCGVTSPKRIRHMVNTVLDEFSPTRGSFSSQGIRNPKL